jgi:serine/threonine-protein kinase
MHVEIAAFAERYDLSVQAVQQLGTLFAQHHTSRSLVTTFEGYESINVNRTFVDEEQITESLPSEETAETPRISERYEDLGLLGSGGMGEVRRVRDIELNRTLAMKTLHIPLHHQAAAVARFLEEAQTTAQLQHPNIVPIHDIGCREDGRIWFTMKEIRGRTLSEVVQEVHAASGFGWEPGPSGWTFKRIVAAFLSVCNAMAYAHERGVVHRDLKPENVMVGTHGQVYVLDWGLVKVLGRPPVDDPESHAEPLHAAPSADQNMVISSSRTHNTRMGTVAGTPAYMAPEQAEGEIGLIDARTDVYALGAMLYEILTGRAPYDGHDQYAILVQVLRGPPHPVAGGATRRQGAPLPMELVDACERAMAREPAERFDSATALGEEIQAWLDGARKREQALEITENALAGVEEAAQMVERAGALQAEGDALLENIEGWRPEDDKAPGWAKQDQATSLRRAAERKQSEFERGLHGALRVAPELPEAHAALAEWYKARHTEAEAERDEDETARTETLVRIHAGALPESDKTRQQCAAYLKGDGVLSLVTDPPGAEVLLYRYEEHNRRLVEVPVCSLGVTPLRAVSLPMGSYLCVLRHPDRGVVRYPAEVPRLGHWDGVAPGDSQPTPIWLPPKDYLRDDEVYVPAGWFRSGGDPVVLQGHPARRLWCDAMVMHQFLVTNKQYLVFLHDLIARGRQEEALAHAPRERAGAAGERGALLYGFDGTRFSLQADVDGDVWLPDWPVLQVDWHGARAYLAWLADRTGRPWRMPGELEWEKAARGVDGRWYPWGDFLDPSWCCMNDSHRGTRQISVANSFPVDVSPYGVRGTAGNASDWCLDLFYGQPILADNRIRPPTAALEASPRALRVARGGSWHNTSRGTRIGSRTRLEPSFMTSDLAFRGIFHPVPGPALTDPSES